jgi:hypothetical protein
MKSIWARDYFRGVLVIRKDILVPRVMGDVARWFFDALKNMLTAGLLLAMARKTESPALQVLAWLATGLLGAIALTPTQGWYLDPLHPVKSEAVRIAGAVTARMLMGAVVIGLTYFEIKPAIEAIAGWNQK